MKYMLQQNAGGRLAGILAGGALYLSAGLADADSPMTAGSVIDRMSNEEFMAYIAGITEGLAYARYEEGGVEAMSCVFDWFYRTPNTIRQVDQAFRQFPDHYPGAVMGALLRRQCGE